MALKERGKRWGWGVVEDYKMNNWQKIKLATDKKPIVRYGNLGMKRSREKDRKRNKQREKRRTDK